jgi:hypothetical protein
VLEVDYCHHPVGGLRVEADGRRSAASGRRRPGRPVGRAGGRRRAAGRRPTPPRWRADGWWSPARCGCRSAAAQRAAATSRASTHAPPAWTRPDPRRPARRRRARRPCAPARARTWPRRRAAASRPAGAAVRPAARSGARRLRGCAGRPRPPGRRRRPRTPAGRPGRPPARAPPAGCWPRPRPSRPLLEAGGDPGQGHRAGPAAAVDHRHPGRADPVGRAQHQHQPVGQAAAGHQLAGQGALGDDPPGERVHDRHHRRAQLTLGPLDDAPAGQQHPRGAEQLEAYGHSHRREASRIVPSRRRRRGSTTSSRPSLLSPPPANRASDWSGAATAQPTPWMPRGRRRPGPLAQRARVQPAQRGGEGGRVAVPDHAHGPVRSGRWTAAGRTGRRRPGGTR